MNDKKNLDKQVLIAMREYGMRSVLFRNAIRRKIGLTITDSECLSFLSMKGVATPTELARYTGLTTGSTTAMLDRLEKANFISRKPNPEDRRGVLIEINKTWTETVGPMVGGIQQAHNELLARYSDEELEVIADFLTRFTQNVDEYTRMIEQDIT